MTAGLSIVISAYEPRGTREALQLAGDLRPHVDQILVVINSDRLGDVACERLDGVDIVWRPNKGMNIGAWSIGLGMCDANNHVLCLQDECSLLDRDFRDAYIQLMNAHGIALVGETINHKWNYSWQDIAASSLNYPVTTDSISPLPRVDYYLQCLRAWGIEPGPTGRHLRSLVWGVSHKLREHLRSFPMGANKEQCIAAEIGVSRFVEMNLGGQVCQSAAEPFRYFAHPEWRRDGLSKI